MAFAMTLRQWKDTITRAFMPAARKPAPKREKREPATPSLWGMARPDTGFMHWVKAHTKSEARAQFKRLLGGPLPVGVEIEKVGPCPTTEPANATRA